MAQLKVSESPAPIGGTNAAGCARCRRAKRHPVEQAYIGLPEAATYLGVAEKTIRRLIRDDKLPARRLGNRVIKIRIEDLEAVLSPMGGGAA